MFIYFKKIFELIVQLAEHVAHNNAVVGSSPTWLKFNFIK